MEDGEYDWMKLNGGRGWEQLRAHPSAHNLHNPNPPPEASARALHGAPGARPDGRPSRDRAGISSERLNAAQPPPPGSPAKPGVAALSKNQINRQSGAGLPKRSSGLQNQLEVGTPTASTQAQFQASNLNLGKVQNSSSPPNAGMQMQNRGQAQYEHQQGGFMQKLMKSLCCG